MESPAPAQPTLTQFGLRGLIATVTLIAVLSAVVSPWLRTLDAESQQRFAIRLALFTAGMFVGLLFRCFNRWLNASSYGQCRLVVYSNSQSWSRWVRPAVAVLFTAFWFCGGTRAFFPFVGKLDHLAAWLTPLMFGAFAAYGLAWLWWNRLSQRFEFYDRFLVVSDGSIRPWEVFGTFHWSYDQTRLVLRGKYFLFGSLTMAVPSEQHDEVDRIVRRVLPCQ